MRFDPSGDTEFQLERMLNDGLELDDNLRGGLLELETTGEIQEIRHNLGYTPNGFLILLTTGETTLWAEKLEDWNSQSLYLKSSVPSLTVRLFVL